MYGVAPIRGTLQCKLNALFAPCVGTFKAHDSVLMTVLSLGYMGSRQGGRSVFDGVKVFPATPEALMAEIDTAISSFEYAQASALLNPSSLSSSSSCSSPSKSKITDMKITLYDADIAEEAYRMACVALAEGKVDEALYSLKVAIVNTEDEKREFIKELGENVVPEEYGDKVKLVALQDFSL
ncbi:hypothetical protein AKJ16_DCAP10439 [Drosera capensis]